MLSSTRVAGAYYDTGKEILGCSQQGDIALVLLLVLVERAS
jgi:hypothetical protein